MAQLALAKQGHKAVPGSLVKQSLARELKHLIKLNHVATAIHQSGRTELRTRGIQLAPCRKLTLPGQNELGTGEAETGPNAKSPAQLETHPQQTCLQPKAAHPPEPMPAGTAKGPR